MAMVEILIPSLIGLGGLGILFGTILAIASRKFAVKIDPKVERVFEVLPGVNCGACGHTNCRMYAEAVVEGRAEPDKCRPGGPDVAKAIAEILGVSIEVGERKVAFLHCKGGTTAVKRFAYDGVPTCEAASLISQGDIGCVYGCLGLYDCVEACNFDAFEIQRNGMPVVNTEKCVGCEACVKACPKNLFTMVPISKKVHVLCVNPEKGKSVTAVCKVGCIGCALCVKACKYDAIHMKEGIAVIDYEKCTMCSECVKVCPVDVIHDYQVQNWLSWEPPARKAHQIAAKESG